MSLQLNLNLFSMTKQSSGLEEWKLNNNYPYFMGLRPLDVSKAFANKNQKNK